MSGYRGSDNPDAAKRPLTRRYMKLVPRAEVPSNMRRPALGGRRSRRKRQNQWVPA